MRRFLGICAAVLILVLSIEFVRFHTSFYVNWDQSAPVSSFARVRGKTIELSQNGGDYEPFEIRGVDLGAGYPGYYATDYAITKETYLRWLGLIQEMGANTVRVYTILSPDFYDAFYEYNTAREAKGQAPLYLLHGLWLKDYTQNSHRDAFDKDFRDTLMQEAHTVVDVLHGHRALTFSSDYGSGRFRRDVSPWVLGYILGVEWEDFTVLYTDLMNPDKTAYQGEYMVTTADATPFERVLAELGDTLLRYESGRYHTQKLIAFANWPTTDPLEHSETVAQLFKKAAKVDVEHIACTAKVQTGQFASYHIYPYYPDYMRYETEEYAVSASGEGNYYEPYLRRLVEHHSMPVVISEFGVPTSRGMAQRDEGRGFSQGGINEQTQAEALTACWQDIQTAGCAGGCIFTWQDEWFKRTWNTMHAVDLSQTPYWSDYQTNEQYFGLLSFDPGKEQSICYVDGDDADWADVAPVSTNGEASVSLQYDEKFIYFLVRKPGYRLGEALVLPIDTTPKTGSATVQGRVETFQRPADFVLLLNGESDSRLLVQKRYEALSATYSREIYLTDAYWDPPAKDTAEFVPIRLPLEMSSKLAQELTQSLSGRVPLNSYETGLLTYGNANPASPNFDSLADFCAGDGFVEIKLPWQLLNFSNPSDMEIHDDYYEHYGIEDFAIKELYVGVAAAGAAEPVPMGRFALRGWGNHVTFHERLKAGYYVMQALWAEGTGDAP